MNCVTPALQMILKLRYLKIINDRVNVGEDFDTGYWEFVSSSLCSAYPSSNTYEGRAWYRTSNAVYPAVENRWLAKVRFPTKRKKLGHFSILMHINNSQQGS